jgi:hypothetical protein
MEKVPAAARNDFVLPKVDTEVVPYPSSAIRATNFGIEFDGGSFVLKVFENREDASPRATPVATKRQNVEIARFTVSPVALQGLDATLQQAKRSYVAAMGHELPDNGKILPALMRLAAEAHAKQPKAK